MLYAATFAPTLGVVKAIRLQGMENPLEQDFALKEALGIGRAGAERAYRLLHAQCVGQVQEPRRTLGE